MATIYPTQQPPSVGESALPNPNEAVPGSASGGASASASASASSGSIGPFFAVISVLTVLAILSCYFGHMYNRRQAAGAPLGRVGIGGGFFGWVKRKWHRCVPCGHPDVEFGGNKVVFGEEKGDVCKVRDGEVSQLS